MDRPLRGAPDYQRFAGRLAKIVVCEPVDGQSHFEGRLVGLDEDQVVLVVGKKEKRLPLALDLARAAGRGVLNAVTARGRRRRPSVGESDAGPSGQ